MKRVIFLILTLMFFPTLLFAQSGLINPNQVAPITINLTASENLTAGDVVSIVNGQAKKNNLAVNTSPNGAESVFNSDATSYCSAVALDENRVMVVYVVGDRGKAIVGTVSGSSISWGSASADFETAKITVWTTAALIDTDKVLAVYGNSSDTNSSAVVLSVSGTTITVNTHADFDASNFLSYPSVTKLDTDKALICFQRGADTYGRAVVCSVSTTTPSFGTIADFNAAATAYISCSALSATSAIVAYQDGGNSSYGTAQVLSISGTTITPGTEYVFKAANAVQWCACTALSSTTAVIAYRDSNNPYLAAVFATNTGGALGYGTELVTTLAGINASAITTISSTKVLVACDTYVNPTHTGKSVIINSSGTTLTADTAYTTNAAGSYHTGTCYLGNQKSVIAFLDVGNSSYGTAVVNQWATPSYGSIRGLCTTTTASGNSAPILISGSFDGLTSLVTGSQYFVGADYGLTTAPVSLAIMKNSSTQTGEIYFGTAKSSTEIIVGVDYK